MSKVSLNHPIWWVDLRVTCKANDDQSHQAVPLVQCTMLPHLTPVLIISLAAVLRWPAEVRRLCVTQRSENSSSEMNLFVNQSCSFHNWNDKTQFDSNIEVRNFDSNEATLHLIYTVNHFIQFETSHLDIQLRRLSRHFIHRMSKYICHELFHIALLIRSLLISLYTYNYYVTIFSIVRQQGEWSESIC